MAHVSGGSVSSRAAARRPPNDESAQAAPTPPASRRERETLAGETRGFSMRPSNVSLGTGRLALGASLCDLPLRAELREELSDRIPHEPRGPRLGVAAGHVTADRIDRQRPRTVDRLELSLDVPRLVVVVMYAVDEQDLGPDR